ncbi:GNAT family N-acetyltransferase [Actinospica durhamensis]|uniref:GNAT family N-acetyltransferase n=1 Tax=Actinospica durhamensis TaxID=1508375 RepID=A0A941EKG5_9ACTN|nr:GNAT family N-acetyltransferase [Actinospica durhamensis]MBR7832836.1 GNAT family N-acetyltransferase [Actinospica durhamensis]
MPVPRTSADELFAVAADCWGYLETERIDGWELRAGAGFTHRANSVWPVGSLTRELPAALVSISTWYAGRELPALVQAVIGSELDDMLTAHGCEDGVAAALRQTASVPEARAFLAGLEYPNVPISTADRPQERWALLYRAGTIPPQAKQIMGAGDRFCYATVYDEASGRPLAIGRGVLAGPDHSWVGLAAIETAPQARRRGLARLIIKTLLDWAAEHGATDALLEVTSDNAPALALYASMGFTTGHAYHYRPVPGPDAARVDPVAC